MIRRRHGCPQSYSSIREDPKLLAVFGPSNSKQISTLLLKLGFHGFLTSVDRLVRKSGEMCNSMPPGFSRGYE